jgi:hypothetical protein
MGSQFGGTNSPDLAEINQETDNLATMDASLVSIDGKLPALQGGAVPVTFPAGAATSAKQDTGNVSLASIDGKLPALEDSKVPVLMSVPPYDSSLFGGYRSHLDKPIFERLHDYPGISTAYDSETYGYEADGGAIGSISHVVNEAALKLSVSAGTVGAKSRLRTHDIMRYQPGCMPVAQITGYGSAAMSSLKCMRRSSVTGVVVNHELATIAGYDANKANRYEIRYAYLGVQGAYFFINGTMAYQFNAAGILSVPYMKTANLPLSVEIVNVGANEQVVRLGIFDDSDGLFFQWTNTTPVALDFTYKCSSVRLVGGNGYAHRSFAKSVNATGVGATLIPLWSMRAKSTINGVSSRAQIFPAMMTFFSETNAGALSLVWNAQTLTGATFAASTPSEAVEIDTAAAAITIGTGSEIFRTGQGQNISQNYPLEEIFHLLDRKIRRQAFTGTSDVLTFAVQREGAANFDPRVTCTWMELR